MSRILQVAQDLSKPTKSFNLMVAIKLVIHQHDVAKVQIIFETLIALEGIIRITSVHLNPLTFGFVY